MDRVFFHQRQSVQQRDEFDAKDGVLLHQHEILAGVHRSGTSYELLA